MRTRRTMVSRRQVLRGAGGLSVGLPFLPSLVPGRAFAAEAVPAPQRYFVGIGSYNGGIWQRNMFPGDEALTESQEIAAGHTVRRGRLARQVEADGQASVSRVLRAPAADLSERMVSRLNVLRGLDMPFRLGHHSGGYLGYYDTTSVGLGPLTGAPTPTIDQVMAWSPSFYPSLAGVRARSVHRALSYGWSNPAARSGVVQKTERFADAAKLFSRLFYADPAGAAAPGTGAPPRPPIVDSVLRGYRSLREGNRRLAPGDRRRLDDHIERLRELEREVTAVSARDLRQCREPVLGKEGGYQAVNSVIALAFMCGYTRIATLAVNEETFAPMTGWTAGTWHDGIAHKHANAEIQETLILPAHQGVFAKVVLDLARKLDVEEAPGVTLLDNALVMWTLECEENTHSQMSLPVVTMGGAGGALRAGLYCDYRNLAPTALVQGGTFIGKRPCGLTWNRLLATLLQSMGVPRGEYEAPGQLGYGNPHRDAAYSKVMAPGLDRQMGDFLPFLKA